MRRVALNKKLSLEHRIRTPDGAGGYHEVWSTLGALWGEIAAASGSFGLSGEVSLLRVTHRITVRAAPLGAVSRPVPGMRFRADRRVFQIAGVFDEGSDGRYLRCDAVEETAI